MAGMRVEGHKKLRKQLRHRARVMKQQCAWHCVVGYAMRPVPYVRKTDISEGYAVYAMKVHFDITPPLLKGTERLYLTNPMHRSKDELAKIIVKSLKNGKTIAQSLKKAGDRLKELSQEVVPYDTGNLHDSAFCRLEKGDTGGGKD